MNIINKPNTHSFLWVDKKNKNSIPKDNAFFNSKIQEIIQVYKNENVANYGLFIDHYKELYLDLDSEKRVFLFIFFRKYATISRKNSKFYQ